MKWRDTDNVVGNRKPDALVSYGGVVRHDTRVATSGWKQNALDAYMHRLDFSIKK
jgi:hypothetical protein